ncbi:hypothetical protein [Echinicola rosea]|uniref:Homing endonuclease LAGLIDADG domain-containing protein n=1 Tax=Echinicola rosea TaxID=1807691 RepID=A0ABQ1VAG9_9BACT|nr:hypothetical protein [Echinicola rosea]GGF49008.1 hypothetical protein GCM10011339_42060 [Echinicola rosea]
MKKKKSKVIVVDIYEKYTEIGNMYSSRWRKLDLFIPSNFRLLCAILKVKPEDILMDFMWMLCYGNKDATDNQIKSAQKFFIAGRFGQPSYSKKEIKQMFRELKAVRTIYDTTEKMNIENKELFWKSNHMYTEFWYKRWFEKNTRKEDHSVLEKF